MDDEGCGYVIVSVLVFAAVWIGCTIAWGPLGFMLGWMPALVLALIWPLIAVVGVGALVLVVALVLLVYVCAETDKANAEVIPSPRHVVEAPSEE